jgi:hypothetical protein
MSGEGGKYLQNLINTMVEALVDETDKVELTLNDAGHTIILELKVSDIDRGKVIGRHGRNATAMRTIVNAAATKIGRRVVFEIVNDR